MTTSDLLITLICVTCLGVFLVVIVHTFLQTRSINAVNKKLAEFRADPRFMDAVEAGIMKTVPVEVVKEWNQRFDTMLTLIASFATTPDQRQLASQIKDIATKVTDGLPNS